MSENTSQLAPQISVLIPTYRRPQLLRRAISSALAQRGPAVQVCVYDNASGDATAEVVAELAARDPRIQYYCHDHNIGSLANFQFALARVDTPLFSFLSDDDLLLPGFFEEAVSDFGQFPDAMFWAGTTVRMTPEGRVYDAHADSWPREGLYTPADGLRELLSGNLLVWTGILFRREVVTNVGLLDLEVGGPSDVDYVLRIAAQYPFVVRKWPAAIFMLNPDSFSETAPFSTFWPGWLKMIENIVALASRHPHPRREIEQRLNANAQRMLFRRGASALSHRNYPFTRQAAGVLRQHYKKFLFGGLLSILTGLCARYSILQSLYTAAYRCAEHHLLTQRSELQARYGHLARYL